MHSICPLLALSVLVATSIFSPAQALPDSPAKVSPETLRAEFAEPPMERRLRAWWFWTIPFLNPEGIAKDVAAMQEAGMGGVNLMTHGASSGTPKGWGDRPAIPYNSDAYYDLVRRTLDDFAARGMKFDTHNVEFYKGAAGRWLTHDQGMRVVRLEHLHVTGPKKLSEPWPAFPTGKDQWGADAKAWGDRWPAVFGVNKPPIPPGDRSTFRPIAAFAVPGHIQPPDQVEIQADLLLDRSFEKGAKLVGREGTVPGDRIVRLDGRIAPDGVIQWDVPAGDWTILRFFSEPTGHQSAGIEVDKWDRALFMDTVDKQVGTIVEQNKQHIGKTFLAIEQDSWESSIQTWSANMAEVFAKRRGYDPLPWLPVLAGVAVNSRGESERFLWDFRRTIADQFTFVGWIALLKEWANTRGLLFSLEGRVLPFINYTEWWSMADKPMDERWFSEPWQKIVRGPENTAKAMVAAVADYYRRPVVGLEAFTDLNHIFMEHPGAMKPLADSWMISGLNQLIPHCYAAQPFDEKPGYRIYGVNVNRSCTWWDKARPFFLHIGRTQTLLQQLEGVADLLLVEDETPIVCWQANRLVDNIPGDFLHDACDAYQLAALQAADGQIVSPQGKRYAALLYLAPEVSIAGAKGRIRPEILAQLERLTAAGARVHSNAPQPAGSPSLTGFPATDQQAGALGKKLWGGGHIRPWDKMTEGLVPDIAGHGDLRWTHRRSDTLDAYLLANLALEPAAREVSFRISGKAPQLWHPERGTVEPILVWREEDGRTAIPLRFDPLESFFVVFTKDAAATKRWTALEGSEAARVQAVGGKPFLRASEGGTWNLKKPDGGETEVAVPAPPPPVAVSGPWQLSYPPGQDTPATLTLDTLQNMREHPDPMVRGFSGTVTYRTTFTVPGGMPAAGLEFLLDLGDVQQLAAVRLNGRDLGIAYRRPYVLPAGGALKEGSNELEVEVTNTWLNRMVAQKDLPEEKRLGDPSSWLDTQRIERMPGYKPLKDQGYLMDSGLIGPVRIRAERIVPIP